MVGFFGFVSMALTHQMGRQRLNRVPEPTAKTESMANVMQYDRVMATKLVIAYALGLEIVYRARAEGTSGKGVDLACGPGHYTLCLTRYLGYEHMTGIDLSEPMIEAARRNAMALGLAERAEFRTGDITHLENIDSGSLDLASFTDAAHHMPDLQTVEHVLREMDRMTKPDGLVMVMDLVRLRTSELTEKYVHALGQDYVAQGLPDFFNDFRNSMYAAWTVREINQAIPRGTRRLWRHLVPGGLPTVQVILGLPAGQQNVFLRKGLPWSEGEGPISADMRWEWKMLRRSLFLGGRFMHVR
jgi:ubiquinone/menaquinone biosynthesis C-methylase UbiE